MVQIFSSSCRPAHVVVRPPHSRRSPLIHQVQYGPGPFEQQLWAKGARQQNGTKPWLVSILLMVQKSGVHQLRLVVYPIIYKALYFPRWLFGISSIDRSSSACEQEITMDLLAFRIVCNLIKQKLEGTD